MSDTEKVSAAASALVSGYNTALCEYIAGEGCGDEAHYNALLLAEKALQDHIAKIEADLETERMRLVACGVVARANTEASAARERLPPDHPYRSASYDDVVRAVDVEMDIRRALFKYHLALDMRHHGGTALTAFFQDVEAILDHPWNPGEALRIHKAEFDAALRAHDAKANGA